MNLNFEMMKNLKALSFLYLILFCSCAAQTQSKYEWRNFDFSESGIKVALPCEPSKKARVFQEEPKLAKSYIYNCENDGFDLTVSLSEHFGEFDENNVKERFDGIQEMMSQSIADKGSVTAKDLSFQTYSAREITARNENVLGKLLLVQNSRGTYNAQIRLVKKSKQSKAEFEAEFEKNAKLFFESFEIYTKQS